jgi:hypothetical protein
MMWNDAVRLALTLNDMSQEILKIGSQFGVTAGLAAFVGVPGSDESHAHWAHQIVIDLDGGHIECYCEGQWIKGQGVFVPAGHAHHVPNGRFLSLFFDPAVDWISEEFGGALDTSCAQVLDRDTLHGLQTCFNESEDLGKGLAIFASAFAIYSQINSTPGDYEQWKIILDKAKAFKATSGNDLNHVYSSLGQMFSDQV